MIKEFPYEKNSFQILKQNLDDLLEAKKWLVHSYQVCDSFKSKKKISVSDYDALEIFLSRFPRVCDLLFRKMFRSIDVYELEPQGSLLDVLNRSGKKGLVDSSEQDREWTELGNQIVHDFAHHDLNTLFVDALDFTPHVLKTIDSTEQYCKKLLEIEPK